MRISDLIKHLESIKDESGDLRCFTNDEFGSNAFEEIFSGNAEIEKTQYYTEELEYHEVTEDVFLHIGGF